MFLPPLGPTASMYTAPTPAIRNINQSVIDLFMSRPSLSGSPSSMHLFINRLLSLFCFFFSTFCSYAQSLLHSRLSYANSVCRFLCVRVSLSALFRVSFIHRLHITFAAKCGRL